LVKQGGQWYFKRHTIYNETSPTRFIADRPNPLKR